VEGVEVKNALLTIGAFLALAIIVFCLFAIAGMGWQFGKMVIGM